MLSTVAVLLATVSLIATATPTLSVGVAVVVSPSAVGGRIVVGRRVDVDGVAWP